ncbi:MAG: transglutaminase domain-containing protein [Brotaphodocola sp.]
MSKLHFNYWMEISYTELVKECHYIIKCLPKDTDMQRILNMNIAITPDHDYQKSEDSFGNQMVYGNLYFEHKTFAFQVSGIAETGLSDGDRENDETHVGKYRYPHGMNRAGDGIRQYFEKIMRAQALSEVSMFKTAEYLMLCLYRDFSYQKDMTDMSTTAEQAWNLGCGVCQDYAHILIALCHLAKIPARYVTGMMIGEGFSHAWVEVLSDGIWYGLDPTNGCAAGASYIKIGTGRDANDCMINRGVVKGGGLQRQSVIVRVDDVVDCQCRHEAYNRM